MTIVAIMKDNDDPKLQMAAAKMLLDKKINVKGPQRIAPMPNVNETSSPTADDVDAAIALAKQLLDELAGRKTQELDSAGPLVADGAPGTDNAKG